MAVMDDVLVEPLLSSEAVRDPAVLATRLLAENDQLRSESAGLRRENLELRQLAGYWRSMHARATQRLEEMHQELELLRGEIRKLKADLFGRKSEKHSRKDRSNGLTDPQETASKPTRHRGQQPDRPAPKRRDYGHLPERVQQVELPPEQCYCPDCGKRLKLRSDTEAASQIEIEVILYRRVWQRCRYETTCQCAGKTRVLTAPVPPKVIAKGLYGTSLWVEILVDKFYSQQPVERLLEQLRLHDLDLAAGTVADGLQRLEPLFAPVYEALKERNGQSFYRQADETRWYVFVEHDGKSNHCWWLWAFSGEDTVVYCLDPSRSHTVPEDYYPDDVEGRLLVDRLSSYKAMEQVKRGLILLAWCWAHVRRDFVRVGKGFPELKDWALAWLRRIQELYRLNRERLAVRKNKAKFAKADRALRRAIVALQQQRDAELAERQLRLPCRQVLESLQEHWEGLTRFVDDPCIPMDNNASERRLRNPALGRKNYYGSGSLWSGRLAAMLFSIFATLKMGQLNPRKWLEWYLDSCAKEGGKAPSDIQSFLPWNLSPEQRRVLGGQDTSCKQDSS
jgi:transposase